MPANTRELRRRIKSIGNTKKITKAMELVSAAKMRRAVQAVLATRTYAKTAWAIVQELAGKTDESVHPLLRLPEKVTNIAVVLIASNRGLSGSFNRDVIDEAADYITRQQKLFPDAKADIIVMGKKGKDIALKHGHDLIAEFSKIDVAPKASDVTTMAKIAIGDFLKGKYQKVAVCYTDFKSTLKTIPTVVELLPLTGKNDMLGSTGDRKNGNSEFESDEYIFEPSVHAVLDRTLRRLVELQMFQAVLESNASEHAARMIAMRQATDAGNDMIEDLTFVYNQARQASITNELADISGGRAALE